VHNQQEKWEALAPKINAAEDEEIARMIKTLILGSMGIPSHWYGEGGDVNKSTAEQMAPPILRRMRRKQAQWKNILTTVLQFAVDQAVTAGRLSATLPDGRPRDMSFNFDIPTLSVEDAKTFWEGVNSLVDALTKAVVEQFVTRKRAAEMFAAAASREGAEVVPPTDEEVAAEQTAADTRAAGDLRAATNKLFAQVRGKGAPTAKPKSTPGQGPADVAGVNGGRSAKSTPPVRTA
jgi:hypothetical protein